MRNFNIQMWDGRGGCIEHKHRMDNEKVNRKRKSEKSMSQPSNKCSISREFG